MTSGKGRSAAAMVVVVAASCGLPACTSMPDSTGGPRVLDAMNRRAERDTPQVVAPGQPFDERATRAAMEPGEATLEGVLFSRADARGYDAILFDKANPILPARRQKVRLYPITPYAVEYINLFKRQRQDKSPQKKEIQAHKGFHAYSRVVDTDDYGRFRFAKLKPGRYFLAAESELRGETQVEVEKGTTKYAGQTTGVHYATEARTWTRPVVCEMVVEIRPGEKISRVDARLQTNPSEWAKPLPASVLQ
jgi:hypothetical protein